MRTAIFLAILVAGTIHADARSRHRDYASGGVPSLDVQGSCRDAQKFSTSDDKNTAYKGCIQDEMSAKGQLSQRWSTFKASDRQTCVEQARTPSPSYVEVLTCLEMNSGIMSTNAQRDGTKSPQIGGPVAPGLPASPNDPSVPAPQMPVPVRPHGT